MTDLTTKCFRNKPWFRNDASFKWGQKSTERTIKRLANKNIIENLYEFSYRVQGGVLTKLIQFYSLQLLPPLCFMKYGSDKVYFKHAEAFVWVEYYSLMET